MPSMMAAMIKLPRSRKIRFLVLLGAVWTTIFVLLEPSPNNLYRKISADDNFEGQWQEVNENDDVDDQKSEEEQPQENLDVSNETSVPMWKFVPPPNIFGYGNLGEDGIEVEIPKVLPPNIQKIHDEGWAAHQFNQYVSDLISVNRSLPDRRTEYCRNFPKDKNRKLPATSVIIIFHNEAWSTLLRSVHSVLNRSPEHLITEVILVDDFSDMGECSAWRLKLMT